MALTKPKVASIRGLDDLGRIKSQDTDTLRAILSLIDNKLHQPLEITVAAQVVSLTASEYAILESDDAGGTQGVYTTGLSPIERKYLSFAASTLNLATGNVTGAFETGGDLTAPPSMTAGQKVYLGFEANSAGKIHIMWSEVGATPDVNTIAWGDESLKRGFIKLTCANTGTGWAADRFSNPTAADIWNFGGSGGGGGGGGDSSFKVRSIAGTTAQLARGAIRLSDGRTLVTGAGTTSLTTRVDIAVDLSAVQGGTATPTNATTYYLYLDLLALGAPTTLTDTGETVTRVSAAGAFLLASGANALPDTMDPDRFVYLAWFRSATSGTTWVGTGSSFGTAPARLHVLATESGESSADFPDANYFKNPNFEIDQVGSTAPKFVVQGGQAGTGMTVTNTVGEVLQGTRSLKLTGGNTGGSLRTWDFELNSLSGFDATTALTYKLLARTTSALGTFKAVIYNVTDAVELPYTEVSVPNGDADLSVTWQALTGKTYKLRVKEAVATTGTVMVDDLRMRRDDAFKNGGVRQRTLSTSTNSTSLALAHGMGGTPQGVALWYYDGTNYAPLDASSHVIKVDGNNVTLNTNDLDFTGGKYLDVKVTFVAGADVLALNGTQFRSGWYQNTSTTTVAHGLGDVDAIRDYQVMEWDLSVNPPTRRKVEGLVSWFDKDNFYLDWTGFSPSATLQYQVVAGSGVMQQGIFAMAGGYTKFVGMVPGSYVDLASALAAASAGDRILVFTQQNITSTITVSVSDIVIEFMPLAVIQVGAAVTALSITGSNVDVRRAEIHVEAAYSITDLVSITGDDCNVEFRALVNNAGAAVTNCVNFLAASERCFVNGSIKKPAGTVTNSVTDAGTDNYPIVRG